MLCFFVSLMLSARDQKLRSFCAKGTRQDEMINRSVFISFELRAFALPERGERQLFLRWVGDVGFPAKLKVCPDCRVRTIPTVS